MTRRELNLAIFEGTANQVLWQPRLETWIFHHQAKGTLPDRYKDLDYLGIYDALHASVRYAASAGLESYLEPDDITVETEQTDINYIVRMTSPSGTVTTIHQDCYEEGQLANRRIAGFPVKTPADLRVDIDLLDRTQFRANLDAYNAAADNVGHRGAPTGWLSSDGFTELIKNYTGLIDANYLLHDYPAAVEEYIDACNRRDDRMLDAALELPFRIYNLGDHTTNEFTPPPILKRFCLPRWQKITARLHANDRFVHTHWDGNSRLLLPYLRESGLDGVEALPPLPMGDMTLEEIKAAVGESIVCLDLLPAVHFMTHYSMATCLDFTKRVIDMFAPRLILGVSDEISQVGEIEKIEAITDLVDKTCGLAD